MSARYVWERYETQITYTKTQTDFEYHYGEYPWSVKYIAFAASSAWFNPDTGNYEARGLVGLRNADGAEISAREYRYLILMDSRYAEASEEPLEVQYPLYTSSDADGLYWTVTKIGSDPTAQENFMYIELYNKNNHDRYSCFRLGREKSVEKKSVELGRVSSPLKTGYPQNGILGEDDSVWYEYLGSDSIDPLEITYSQDWFEPGKPITATAQPASPTYGGDILYEFSYKREKNTVASWFSLGPPGKSNSITFTVPQNAETIQVRAQASDEWGFTSTTYVKGAALPLRQLVAYGRIGGKARQLEKGYVNIGGKAREITAAYARVDGKAKKLF